MSIETILYSDKLKEGTDKINRNFENIKNKAKSAYELWLEQGNSGTIEEFLNSLNGKDAVINPGSITPDQTSFIVSGKNLFNKDAADLNKVILKGNGNIDSTGYHVTHLIFLKQGEKITISRFRNFEFDDVNHNLVEYYSTASTNYTYTAPQDGYFRATIYQADLDTLQIEYGSVATSYEPYSIKFVDYLKLNTLNTKNFEASKKGNIIDITSVINNKAHKISVDLLGSQNNSFTFISTYYDGKLIHSTTDDITPIRTFSTVGGNHGYTSVIDLPLNGKTTADLGSKWSDGTTTYTLLRIVNNRLILGCPYTINSDGTVTSSMISPTSDLIHVSGATNTDTISTSGIVTSSQLYPSTGKVNVSVSFDGNVVSKDGTYQTDNITIVENYEILDYKSIIDYAQNNIGKDYAAARNSINGVVAISNTFIFNDPGKCTTSHSIRALQKVTINRTGVLQSVALTHPTLPIYRLVPNLKAMNGVDFTQSVALATYNTTNLVTSSNLIESNKPVNRYYDYIMNGSNVEIAYSMGHVIDKTNSKNADRLVNTNILWDFRNTKKSYPIVLENKVMNAGDYYNFEGYRNYFVPKSESSFAHFIKDRVDTYFVIDEKTVLDFKSYQFEKFIGAKIEVISSKDFTLKSDVIDANGINYSITAPKGYAIIKVV